MSSAPVDSVFLNFGPMQQIYLSTRLSVSVQSWTKSEIPRCPMQTTLRVPGRGDAQPADPPVNHWQQRHDVHREAQVDVLQGVAQGCRQDDPDQEY